MKFKHQKDYSPILLGKIDEFINKINQTKVACTSNCEKNILEVIATQKQIGRFKLSEQKDEIYDVVTNIAMSLGDIDRDTAQVLIGSNSSLVQ